MEESSFSSTQIIKSSEKVWGTSLHPAGCQECGQAHLVNDGDLGTPCPLCCKGKLESRPARVRPEAPESLIPFRIKTEEVRNILNKFTKGIWFRPADFNPEAMAERIRTVYWPKWMVDSDISGSWQAEVGFNYEVKSSQESYGGGGWQTREVIETRVKWEPRAGQINRHYDNIVAPALYDEDKLTHTIGNYDFEDVIPYKADDIKKSLLRIPDLIPESAWQAAKTGLDRAASSDCFKAAGAQHIRGFSINADYGKLNWTQLLFPMYVTYYTDDNGAVHPVYINGQSGNTGGVRMASQRKGWLWGGITGGIALLFAIGTILLGLITFAFPPAIIFAALLAILTFVLGITALIMVIWPWQWNRKQKPPDVVSK